MDSQLTVSQPSYLRQPDHTDYNNRIEPVVDKIWRSAAQAMFLVNENAIIPAGSFMDSREVSIWNWPIHNPTTYNEGADKPLGTRRRLQADLVNFRVTETLAFNAGVDKLTQIHNNVLQNIGRWAAYNVENAIVPAIDNNVFGNLIAFIAANGYETSYTRASDSFYQTCVKAQKVFEDRTDLAAKTPCLVTTPAGYERLKLDAKFNRDNEVAQRQIIAAGAVGQVDGMMVYKVSENRLGTTYDAIIVDKSVCTFAMPYRKLRIFNQVPDYHGQQVDFVVFFDTLIAPNRGAAVQGIKGS